MNAHGLQIIQVAYVPYGSREGSGKYIINGKAFQGFVDNGSHSFNQRSTGTVYYDSNSDLQSPNYYWSGTGGYINMYDATNINQYYSSAVFETIIIETGYNGGVDKVLGSFTWGWNNGSRFGQPASISPNSLNPTISPNSQGVIGHDFPAYKSQ